MRIIFGFLIISSLSVLFGCRKGEDDPLISLRSRTNRLTGTWKLISFESNGTESLTYTTTNDVNDNRTDHQVDVVNSVGLSDDFFQEKQTNTGTITNLNHRWVIANNDTLISVDTSLVEPDIETGTENEYEFILEIKKDDSYRLVKKIKRLREYYIDATKTDGVSNPLVNDSVFTNEPTLELVEEGLWFWQDANKKKIILNAGEVHGYVQELSNKNLTITDYSSEEENNFVELNFRNDLSRFDFKLDYGITFTGAERKVSDKVKSEQKVWKFEKID